MRKLKSLTIFITAFAFLLFPQLTFAHAVVKPSTAGIGSYTDFSLGVPSEKDNVSTISIQLMLPKGLSSVSPFVKPGWQIEVKNNQNMPTEIYLTGGIIPAGQKDSFGFTVQVPSTPTELDWKVIQTYSDGSTISWTIGPKDKQPEKDGKPDFSSFGPYSKTMVVNDLVSPSPVSSQSGAIQNSDQLPLILSLVALVISLSVLARQRKLINESIKSSKNK
jgi:uncharacterized protein YcnI